MNFNKKTSYQIGFNLILLAGGLMLFQDRFDAGIVYSSIYGGLALIGFILMIKGFYESNKEDN